jgi:ATP-dependent Clp protease ATP-binding subunit ClpC
MFERYTEKLRRMIFFARYEVSELGGQSIGPEHLLLGLLREDKSLLPHLLRERDGPVREAIRRRIEENSRVDEKMPTAVELPLTGEAKDVLRYAAEESERLSHTHIGPEHLLLGLLRLDGSFAAVLLRDYGISIDGIKEFLKKTDNK